MIRELEHIHPGEGDGAAWPHPWPALPTDPIPPWFSNNAEDRILSLLHLAAWLDRMGERERHLGTFDGRLPDSQASAVRWAVRELCRHAGRVP